MANWGWSTGTSGYDDEDRLVSWSRDDNNLSQSWTLTKEGDWSQFVENTTTQNRTHSPAHELTAVDSTALTYDPKGNLSVDNTKSHKYTWDFDNWMSAADTDGDNVDDVTMKYDALGRRFAKTSSSATTVYVSVTQPIQYSPFAGQVVAEYAGGAAPASPSEKYVYASYIDEPVLKDRTGGTVYYHRNSQYSVSALTSASGAVVERYGYEPYGELTILAPDGSTVRASSSYANSYTYTGRRWDSDIGLYYFRARYYDPALGRFVGRDPLDVANEGKSLYARGDRLLLTVDPTGNTEVPVGTGSCRTTTTVFQGGVTVVFWLGKTFRVGAQQWQLLLGGKAGFSTNAVWNITVGQKCCCNVEGGKKKWDIVLDDFYKDVKARKLSIVIGNRVVPIDDFDKSIVIERGAKQYFPCEFNANELCQCRHYRAKVLLQNKHRFNLTGAQLADLIGVTVPDPFNGLLSGFEVKTNVIDIKFSINMLACCDGKGRQRLRDVSVTSAPLDVVHKETSPAYGEQPVDSKVGDPVDFTPLPPSK